MRGILSWNLKTAIYRPRFGSWLVFRRQFPRKKEEEELLQSTAQNRELLLREKRARKRQTSQGRGGLGREDSLTIVAAASACSWPTEAAAAAAAKSGVTKEMAPRVSDFPIYSRFVSSRPTFAQRFVGRPGSDPTRPDRARLVRPTDMLYMDKLRRLRLVDRIKVGIGYVLSYSMFGGGPR